MDLSCYKPRFSVEEVSEDLRQLKINSSIKLMRTSVGELYFNRKAKQHPHTCGQVNVVETTEREIVRWGCYNS